ncbi:hypothetical protein PAT3040_00892 [Paenibacillus agaridevorans]|uniref:Glycosyltransferase 2-like domain-containing protein n=1 Tax=Paenibacillus agaridevorans TaxID=171404 RepID=A0A2R5EIM0_9BACL|nr:glycosyltransferase family 2 protein [Paenibacillus agaridevorans]GBG06367.1 hypothetical protein PAT3040_00892 [Paenibacillus agaridevorans]
MKNNAKISIIIPVYNVEKYIEKCLNSIINQTYKNIEVICVNDGSTDKSGNICDEYAAKDHRFKVIHKKNGGNASAVNMGLENFSGKYVGFVDPDDWVEHNCFEDAYKEIVKYNVDFVCFGWVKEQSEKSEIIVNKSEIENGLLNRDQILRYTFIRDVYPAFSAYRWNKLFNSKLFNCEQRGGYGIRACEDLKVGSDVLFFAECIIKSNHALFINRAYYHYYQRADSLFHSKDLEKRKGSLISYSRVLELFERNGIESDIQVWVKRFYVYHASVLAEIAIEEKKYPELIVLQHEIRKYLPEYVETNSLYAERIARINNILNYNT